MIEDYARFGLDNNYLSAEIKTLRHRLTSLIASSRLSVINRQIIAGRDVMGDIGQRDFISRKRTIPDIITANFKRLEESLRSLAEYLKTAHPPTARQMEKLRFHAYELEQYFSFNLYPKRQLDKMRLYVLVSGSLSGRDSLQVIQSIIQGGAEAIQLREKGMPDNKLIKLIKEIRDITLRHKVLFIVNDRVDLAYLGRADGVHLGQDDISVREARQILGPDKIIGATTHQIEEALAAEKNGADYISVGPMFPTPLKPHLPADGFKYLPQVARQIKIPYVAIGGINRLNIRKLIKIHKKLFDYPLKVAVSSGIMTRSDTKSATRILKKIVP